MDTTRFQTLLEEGEFDRVISEISKLDDPGFEIIGFKIAALAMIGKLHEAKTLLKSEAGKVTDPDDHSQQKIIIALEALIMVLSQPPNILQSLSELRQTLSATGSPNYWDGLFHFSEGMHLFPSSDLEEIERYRDRLQEIATQLNSKHLQVFTDFFTKSLSYASIDHEDTIPQLSEIREMCQTEKYRVIEWYVTSMISAFYAGKGDFEKFHEYVMEAKEIWDGRSIFCVAQNYYLGSLGFYYFYTLDLEKSLSFYQQALDYTIKIRSEINLGFHYRFISEIWHKKGKLSRALEYAQLGLKIHEERNLIHATADTEGQLGKILVDLGEFDFALKHYKQGLEKLETIQYEPGMAELNDLMGELLLRQSSYPEAIDHFTKAAILKEKLNNPIEMSKSYFNLIRGYLNHDPAKAQKYIDKLTQLETQEDHVLISLLGKVANAMVLKESNRPRDKAQAQLFFKEVSEHDPVDFRLTILSLLSQAELLIDELRISKEPEIISDLNQIIHKCQDMAHSEQLPTLAIRLKLIQARISIINGDVQTAKMLQSKAETIAMENGLRHLSMVISYEQDELAHVIGDIVGDKKVDLESPDIEQLQSLLEGEPLGVEVEQNREPILMIMINNQGRGLFSYKFGKVTLHDEAISSLITTIQRFVNQAFYETGSIDRIIHEKYTILFKSLDEYSFCFVFEGHSFGMTEKFSVFLETVKTLPAWNDFLQQPDTLDADLIDVLNGIISDLFGYQEKEETDSGYDSLSDDTGYLTLPKELVGSKYLLNPIRLTIIRVLNLYFRFPAADLRKMLMIPWGTFNGHMESLEEKGYIEMRKEFFDENARNILYITPNGVMEYERIKTKLYQLLEPL